MSGMGRRSALVGLALLLPLLILLPAAAPPVAALDGVPGVLQLVDEETGKPVAGARLSRVVAGSDGKSWSHEPIPESERPGEFRVRMAPGIASFIVEAPGYVTMEGRFGLSMEVPASGPFQHTFRLARAGAVRVTFEGLRPGGSLESVLLRCDRSTPRISWSQHSLRREGDHYLMDGLPPGDYAVQVDPGRGYDHVAETPVEVKVGETAEVVVRLVPRDSEKEAAAGVSGTVTFHGGWGPPRSEIEFRGLGGGSRGVERRAPLVGAAAGAAVSYSLGTLPPGRYLVEVRPQWKTEVEVPEGGEVFDFSIPEPAVVRIRVVAEESGKPLPGARVFWYSRPEERRSGISYSGQNAEEGPAKGEYVLLVPPGTLQVTAEAEGRVGTTLREEGKKAKKDIGTDEPYPVFASGEKATRVLRLPMAGSLKLLLRCKGKLLDRAEVEAEILISPDPDTGFSSSTWELNHRAGCLSREGLPPGKHRLRILDAAGVFEAVEDREFTVRPGKETELTQELVRRK